MTMTTTTTTMASEERLDVRRREETRGEEARKGCRVGRVKHKQFLLLARLLVTLVRRTKKGN